MLRTTETIDSLFERQRGTLPDTFGVRPLALAEGRMTMGWLPTDSCMPRHR